MSLMHLKNIVDTVAAAVAAAAVAAAAAATTAAAWKGRGINQK